MDEEIRVTTTRKPKKITTILIAVVAVLGLALIGTAIYFYAIKDSVNKDVVNNKTCGCYYIDPTIISECTDPRRGFLFETITVPEDQTCKASCSTSKLSTNLLKSNTKQDLYQICQLQTIQDVRCKEMVVKDKDGKIITGRIAKDDEITIEAKFEKEYTDYSFTINNESVTPDVISPDKLTIKKTLNSFDSSSLNIVATGKDSNLEQINSPVCRRLIEVTQEGSSNVNEMQIQTRLDNNVLKISKVNISVGNIKQESKISVTFSFSKSFPDLTMKEGFTLDATKGEITILEQDLYNAENFTTALSFSQLNAYEGDLKITADIKDNNTSIGSALSTVIFPSEESLQPGEETPAGTESNFTVVKTANVQCVERVTPNNVVQFTITSTNKSTKAQVISSVKDKLPLGFVYVQESSKINGVSVKDSDYVKSTNVGDSKEIVWSKTDGWSLTSGQALTIVLQATVGPNALTGSNQNEAIITPVEIPTNPASLRTEFVINVQQDCDSPVTPVTPTNPTTPDTGIFDTTIGRVLLGLFILISGWYIYTKPFGRVIISKLINSGAYKTAEVFSWKLFNPKRYFEEKIVRKLRKKIS
ncbi:MAG: hypothetical protein AB9915_01330 [Candidatus Dojkabacteria bacterium]